MSSESQKPKNEIESNNRINALIAGLDTLRNEAMAIGMVRTGHKLHDAIREVGYEFADILSGAQRRFTVANDAQRAFKPIRRH